MSAVTGHSFSDIRMSSQGMCPDCWVSDSVQFHPPHSSEKGRAAQTNRTEMHHLPSTPQSRDVVSVSSYNLHVKIYKKQEYSTKLKKLTAMMSLQW